MPLLPMLGDPNANRSLIQWMGWAGQWPEGRTPTPKPSRKKRKESSHFGSSREWFKAAPAESRGPPTGGDREQAQE